MELITDVLTPFVDGKTYRACTRDMGEVRQRKRWRAGERESGGGGGARRGAVARRRLHAVRVSGS